MKVQSALEYFIVSSFILSVILIGFSLAFRESFSSISQANLRQIDLNIQKIIFYSQSVYSQGYPAKYTLTLNFPIETKIYNISNSLIVEYSKNKFVYPLDFKIVVNESFSGLQKIEIVAENDYVKIRKV